MTIQKIKQNHGNHHHRGANTSTSRNHIGKIKEVGNEEMTITTKHSAKKRAITKVAKEKSKGKSIKPITDSEKKFVASMEKSMKEIAQIEAGKKKPTKAKDFLKHLKNGK